MIPDEEYINELFSELFHWDEFHPGEIIPKNAKNKIKELEEILIGIKEELEEEKQEDEDIIREAVGLLEGLID